MSWLQYSLGHRYIIYCSCGRNMKSSQSPTEFDQNNHDVTSFLGYVIWKNSGRGAHGPSERRRKYYQANQMLNKARQKKHGRHPRILSRWYTSESYRDSWREKHTMLSDRIAVEKHIHVATRADRIQHSKLGFSRWVLGKDHSSQSTGKTATRTTIWGQRRIRLRGWP